MFRDYPTGDYQPFETAPMKMRSGTVVFRIEGADYNDAGTPLSGTMEAAEIGDIKFAFDVPDNEEDPKSIEAEISGSEIKLWDDVELSDGTFVKLHEQLYNAAFSRFPFECSLTVDNGEDDTDFYFTFSYEDIEYDQEQRMVSIELQGVPPFEITETVASAVTNCPTSRAFASGELDKTGSQVAAPYQEFVHRYFETIYGLSVSVPSNTLHISSFLISGVETLGGLGWWVGYNPLNPRTSENTLSTVVASAAALEGAIYGYAFGKGFYMNRAEVDGSLQVTLDSSQFENVEIIERRNIKFSKIIEKVLLYSPEGDEQDGDEFFWDFENRPNFSYSRHNDSFLTVGEDEEDYQSLKEEIFNIVFSRQHLCFLDYDNISEELSLTSQANFETAHNDLAEHGRQTYAKSLGASRPLRVKVTGGWGIFNLKPFETFRLTGSDLPDIFLGKDFRVSEITYSIQKDKFEVEAYQI